MCLTKFIPILFGFLFIGIGVYGLLSSLNPRCEYPERRLVAPIVKMLIWSSIGLYLFMMGGIIPVPSGTCPKTPIPLPCPTTAIMYLVIVYALIYFLKLLVPPRYWRWRLSSWADHNRFALLDFVKLHSASGERACFRVVLRDASGKERKAEVTLGSNGSFNPNLVNLLWLD